MKGIPLLTVKEERFAQLLAIADISQTAAYIDAGYSPTQLRKTLWEKASVLAHKDKVRARVEQIRTTARDNAAMTLEKHLARLDEIGKEALKGDKTAAGNTVKNYGAAVAAEIARGKHSGVAAPDKRQDVTPDIPAHEGITEMCTPNGMLNTLAQWHGMEMLRLLGDRVPSHNPEGPPVMVQ